MSSISQTIPSYVAGISEQPDQLKLSGQVKDCVNALPDVTRMLGKRPGCEFLRQDTGANAHLGKWFDIYRDPNEQYIGSVRTGGTVDVFRVVDAPLRTYRNNANNADVQSREYVVVTNHGSGFTASTTSTNVATTNTTDGNATGLTVNVTTDAAGLISFVTINRMGDPAANAYEHGDVLTITGFGNGAQITYFTGLAGEQCNVKYDDVGHSINDLNTAGTIAPTTADTNCEYLEHTDSDRIKTLTVNDTTAFVNRDTVTAMTNAVEPAAEAEGFVIITTLAFNQVYRFEIIQGGTTHPIVSSSTHSTNQTVEDLLADLRTLVNAVSGFSATIIGNGLHITSTGAVFSMQTSERQIMQVFTDEVQDITLLPDQCHHHYRCAVTNSGNLEDDYYVRFEGANGTDGQGTWVEWREPGVATTIDADTMPHIMFRQSDGSFLVCPTVYDQRQVGDTLTNPTPSFIGNSINNVTLFRNRLGFLSRQNLVLSRPGDFLTSLYLLH